MLDYLKYYELERYLFEDVRARFHENQFLSAHDFFSIIIWKANRAKSKVALKLLKRGQRDEALNLEPIVKRLTGQLYESRTNTKERMRILIKDWEFRLPMASAILTVLWPDEFTVYDVRICEELREFRGLADRDFEQLWEGYLSLIRGVNERVPDDLIANVQCGFPEVMLLRAKDRYLWAKSSYGQLERDIQNLFGVDRPEED
jgi:hypothetical protein